MRSQWLLAPQKIPGFRDFIGTCVCTSIRQSIYVSGHPLVQPIQPHSDGHRLAWQREYSPNTNLSSYQLPTREMQTDKSEDACCHPTVPLPLSLAEWAQRGLARAKRNKTYIKKMHHPKKTPEGHTVNVGAALVSPAE